MGDWIVNVVGQGELLVIGDRTPASFGAFLVDNVVEESLELLAATALLTASLAAYNLVREPAATTAESAGAARAE